ncbi:TonB-dependent receptor [Sphingosinicella terrae]|uniref:TonB-dependent receptor n=1 Tax=Sphingosinicella terrae TaxID=2172047 RepID=UPI0013B427BB|nr:TonB-dependent receptor [Sphingosinicella terrae]
MTGLILVRTTASFGLAALAVTSTAVRAQDVASSPDPAETPAGEAGEADTGGDIVVTANRREQRLQDVPVSVTAVSSEMVTSRGLSDLKGLTEAVPSLVLVRSATSNTPFMRGIGAAAASPSNEPSVATYVDNIYIPSNVATVFDFNNIERIEVLRGPQGTLFGRNAVGGVLHVITRDPGYDLALDADLGIANYETITGNLYASGALAPNLAANLAIHFGDRGEGWGRNAVTGRDTYTYSSLAGRAKLLFEPGPDTRILLAGDYDHFEGAQGVLRTAVPGTVTAGATPNAGFYNVANNVDATNEVDTYGGSLRVDHDFGGFGVTSITAYREVRQDVVYDLDTSRLDITRVTLDTRADTFTQELQLRSLPGSRLEWILGAYFFDNSTRFAPQGVLIQSTNQQFVFSAQKSRSLAAYGQATYEILPRTNLTAGLRYTHDERSIAGITTFNGTQIASAEQEAEFGRLTWRLSVDHRINDDLLAYASYNRGFKSGVFDITSYAAPAVDPEILDSYEIGFKSDWFDRRLRVNVSAFHYDYSDIQVTQILGTTAVTVNAARAKLDGAEIEVTARPLRGLELTASASLLDAKYTSFPNGPHFSPNGAPPTCAIIPYPAGAPGGQTQVPGGCDLSGNRMIFAPKYTLNLGASYSFDTRIGNLTLAASYFHTGAYAFEPDQSVVQDGYGLLNASVAWRSPSERWGLRLWGRNLNDAHFFSAANSTSAGRIYSAGEPLTYGLTLSAHY